MSLNTIKVSLIRLFQEQRIRVDRGIRGRNPYEIAMSERMVAMVQTVFAVVLGQSVFELGGLILHPVTYLVGTIALAGVYVTTIWSWMDWHYTAGRFPYLARDDAIGRTEQLRIIPDVLIVIAYGYLVLTVPSPLEMGAADMASADLSPHLLGYVAVFVLYLVAGRWRQATYGRIASTQAANALALAAMLWLNVVYRLLRPHPALNVLVLCAVMVTTLMYRMGWRKVFRDALMEMLALNRTVGIDIDGVLGDQIAGVQQRMLSRWGVGFDYEDIDMWDKPLAGGATDVKREIESALHDCDYVLAMPLHPGAKEALAQLRKAGLSVVIVTARPASCEELTMRWLSQQGLQYDEIVHVDPGRKNLDYLDYLVDDYPGNVLPFLLHTGRPAFLVDHPWNRSAQEGSLREWIESGQLQVVSSVSSVPDLLLSMH